MPRSEPRLPDGRSEGAPQVEDDAEWDALDIHGGDFAAASGDNVEITGCVVTDAAFTGADLDRLRVTDTVFDRCEFSGTIAHEAALTRVVFRGCRMASVSLHDSRLRDVLFHDCKLDAANFRMMTADSLEMRDSTLVEADFYGAKLPDALLLDCDLTGAQMGRAVLKGTRLQGSKVDDLRGAEHLRGAIIDSAQVLPLALATFNAFGIVVDDGDG